MSEIGLLQRDERSFLEPYLPQDACITSSSETQSWTSQPPRNESSRHDDLPFVTLTYACSLDSMIALAPGARTALSGSETKNMTHYLRLRHDAILIGAGTAAVDDPGLNCRYPGASLDDQPRPVIVDPNGRWDVQGKKAVRLASERSGKAPWIVSRAESAAAEPLSQIGGEYLIINEEQATGSFSPGQATDIPWKAILVALKRKGINSVMIEGGATVINTLLVMPDLVDAAIITIAPTFLGRGGVAVAPAAKTAGGERTNAAWLQETSWRQFGSDAVLCGKLSRE